MSPRRLLVATMIAAFAACGRGVSAPKAFATVDSLPSTDVAGSAPNGPMLFGHITDAFRTADGAVVVADSSEGVVRVVDLKNGSVRTIGRAGDGPGEFRRVAWIGQCRSDSIFVWDGVRDLVEVFDTAGGFNREIHVAKRPWKIRCATGSERMVILGLPHVDGSGASATPYFAPVTITNMNGDSVAAIGSVKMGENRLLGPLSQAVAAGATLFIGTADSMHVNRYGFDGVARASLPIAGSLVPVADSDYQRELGVLLHFFPDTSFYARARAHFAAAPRPAFLPAYSDLRTDPDGRMWALRSRPGQAIPVWSVTDSAGVTRGEVRLPSGVRLFEAGRDYLLGSRTDAEGIDHLVMFKLHQ